MIKRLNKNTGDGSTINTHGTIDFGWFLVYNYNILIYYNNHPFLTADRHVFPWSGLGHLGQVICTRCQGMRSHLPFCGSGYRSTLSQKGWTKKSVHHHHGWITLMITYPKDSKGLFESIWFFCLTPSRYLAVYIYIHIKHIQLQSIIYTYQFVYDMHYVINEWYTDIPAVDTYVYIYGVLWACTCHINIYINVACVCIKFASGCF